MNTQIAIKTTIILLTLLGLGVAVLRYPNIAAVAFGIAAISLIWRIIYIILEDKK